MTSRILVVGGNGTVGSGLVRILKEQGHAVRVLTSKKTEGDSVHADLLTGEGLDAAFEGVDRAFFLSPGGYADQHAVLSPLIAKAKAAGLKKVVMMTAIGVEHADGSPMRRAELELEASGVPFNIIRPNWFMQNFVNFWGHGIKTAGTIALPVGDGKAGFIDARDIAASAAALLLDDARRGTAHSLTGPELLDHAQVAAILAQATGKPVTFKDITPDELRPGLLAAGLPADYVEVLLALLGFLKAGFAAVVTDDVKTLTDKAPRTFKAWAEEFADSLK